MAKNNKRIKEKKPRSKAALRELNLGYYLIVTDTEKTEKNYFNGLRDNLPEEYKEKIAIKVISNVSTDELVDTCLDLIASNPQYSNPWIVLDRDLVKNFDKIIDRATKKGINVGWSNPCFEVWLSAYFGEMPNIKDSTEFCDKFKVIFKKSTKQVYTKGNENNYKTLIKFGNEEKAKNRRKYFERLEINKPSKMFPCTTVDILVEEIRSKTTGV